MLPVPGMKAQLTVNNNKTSVSTLLIPKNLLNKYNQKLRKYRTVRSVLKKLLGSCKSIQGRALGIKTGYQPGGDLVKVNFRPDERDWEMLRANACSLRISMTYLFVLLLMGDDSDGSDGVPTKIIIITEKLKSSVSFTAITSITWSRSNRHNPSLW